MQRGNFIKEKNYVKIPFKQVWDMSIIIIKWWITVNYSVYKFWDSHPNAQSFSRVSIHDLGVQLRHQ